jgi:hypothetical protein
VSVGTRGVDWHSNRYRVERTGQAKVVCIMKGTTMTLVAVGLIVAVDVGLIIWDLPLWATVLVILALWAVLLVVVAKRHPGQSMRTTLRQNWLDLKQPVDRRFTILVFLFIGIPVALLLALAIIGR